MAIVAKENAVIDQIDRSILRVLEGDARISFKDLAERVGLSANAIAERVRKLHDQGIIRGFGADVNPSAFGLAMQALIEVKLEASTGAGKFEAVAASTPGVVRVMVTTGNYDCLLEVIARDQADLQRIIEALRTSGLTRDTYSRVVASDRRFPLTR